MIFKSGKLVKNGDSFSLFVSNDGSTIVLYQDVMGFKFLPNFKILMIYRSGVGLEHLQTSEDFSGVDVDGDCVSEWEHVVPVKKLDDDSEAHYLTNFEVFWFKLFQNKLARSLFYVFSAFVNVGVNYYFLFVDRYYSWSKTLVFCSVCYLSFMVMCYSIDRVLKSE